MDGSTVVDISQSPEQNETGHSRREAHTECISHISDDLLKQKWEAYVPQVVSLGPIHFGNLQVAPIRFKGENNKQWRKQYIPVSKDHSFEKLVKDIKSDQVITEIQKWYERQGNGRPEDERLGEMALDGLFLLRFLREIYSTRRRKPAYLRGHPDPFQPKSQIEEDIMKLENQIPFFVVKMVLEWESNTDRAFNTIISRACQYLCPFQEMNFSHDPPLVTPNSHLLEFMYENIIHCSKEDSQKKKSSCTLRQAADLYSKGVKFMYENIIRSSKEEKVEDNQKKKSISTLEDSQKKKSSRTLRQAADLYSKGVNFMYPKKKSNSTLRQAADLYDKGVKFKAQAGPALNGIRFNDKTRTFYLPAIEMDSKTDTVMRNLLAFEAHKDSGKPLLCYIDLMKRLINEPEDVKVLRDGGIIKMHLSNNREVANVWNDMQNVLDHYGKKGGYIPIDTAVDGVTTFCDSKYCKYRMLYVEFKEKYFSRPWLAAALFGGCFSLLLSLLQTILAWKQLSLQLKGK